MNYLEVSQNHKIYYEVSGNPKGEAILFVHGGPGAGFSQEDKRFFNFDKHKVIFFDQRGASKSIPFGSIIENTTQDLVNDINKLLDYLEIDKITLFGGSWGTTLGLVYAIQNPNRIKKILLRAIFLANKESIEHYLNGGVEKRFPKIWKRFRDNVPTEIKASIAEYYLEKMINGTKEEKKYFSYEWAFYEISIFKNKISKKEVEAILEIIPYEALSIMEAHYLTNNCFLDENYILKNLDKIIHIPVKIIHGKQDAICPLKFAIELNSKLVKSELFIVEGGHSDSEPEIEKKIIEIINQNIW
ncbi:prolyl aminopeptidase [Flavobacterium sp. 90]|uniref:prolyl aminopeptidase n=1 Tax=unclassified Flavobacterium TaxID=196869 RepID=UPI000EAD691E|nr:MULTISPECIES: prolyl aminopeptidase [unclassified Flavobacterium]RKR04556.1 prolyl aminopeptidase [Flavobacterium sp. 81]TCK55885.1 prolyl aminopeptidase [Flavobacterium sp. 90]